jgi:hypothetical protein
MVPALFKINQMHLPLLNIIHLPERLDRAELLKNELIEQGITNFKLWDGIKDSRLVNRGISKAHKQIVQCAKENNFPEVLIGEDDLHFTSKGAFIYFIDNKPEDFDIFLGGIYYGRLMKDSIVNDFSGLTLYIINERFYKKFLSMNETEHLDRALRNSGKFIVCNPMVVIQHNGFSDNLKKDINYESFLKDRLLFTSKSV